MVVYEHRMTVTFAGPFSIDMLRYDGCAPVDESDSYVIAQSLANYGAQQNRCVVTVRKYTASREPRWTYPRWESYGVRKFGEVDGYPRRVEL